jgi:hypothetical protein
MYTWAAFLSLGTILYCIIVLNEPLRKNLAIYGIFLLTTMYIHVYSMVGAFVFHVPVLIYIFLKKRELLPKMFIVWATTIVLYIPWLLNLFSMTPEAKGIPGISLARIFATLVHPFDYREWSTFRFWETGAAWPTYIIVFILTVIGIWESFSNKKRSQERWQIILIFTSFYNTLLFFIIASILVIPIVEPRYMLCLLGAMLLPFTWAIVEISEALTGLLGKKFSNKKTRENLVQTTILLLFIVWYSTANAGVISDVWKNRYNGGMREAVAIIKPKLKEDDVFFHTHELTLGTFSYYFPNHKHYFYRPEDSTGNWPPEVFQHKGEWSQSLQDLTEDVNNGWLVSYTLNFNPEAHNRIARFYRKTIGRTEVVELPYSWYKVTFARLDTTAE